MFCLSLASFSFSVSGGLTMLLWSSLSETCNYILGAICFSVWLSIENLSKSLDIYYCKNCGWFKTKLYGACLKFDLIFVCNLWLWIIYHEEPPVRIELCFVLADTILWFLFLTYNNDGILLSEFIVLGFFIVPDVPTESRFL